ncbi:flagellar protein FlgN [Paenibacillus mendelii]|uniref:Flagellar protein FlgN n=1 Tax=Paenibacillus mendelii TaxID=206163 RepID=A0ABV6J3E9_9BACL|nr:flagellar protein FlgN [Paenibacillus mendelii]MCQ6563556.1 flagellar protein FlgN [Paenibacillus mendelii]
MSVQPIIEILQQQEEVYRQLITTAEQKTPVLVNNDLKQLNIIMKQERALVKKAEELEKLRYQMTYSYFAKLGTRYRYKLVDLIQVVYVVEEKKSLMRFHTDLNALLSTLQTKNELNQQLIQQSLSFLDYSLDLLVDYPNEEYTYQHPQQAGYGKQVQGKFDKKS